MAAAGAVTLVLAFAIASLLSPLLSLSQLLAMKAPEWVAAIGHAKRNGASLWLWDNIAVPLLVRPAWLIPTMLGIIFVGVAAQLAWGARR